MQFASTNTHTPQFNSVAQDVQYELSRCFMNYAKDQLLNKQYDIIIKSNHLLDNLTRHLAQKSFEHADKQYCNPKSSNTLDTLMTQQDELPRARQRPFVRRSGNGPQRVLNCDYNMNIALQQIKENCSVKTFSTVTSLIQNYNKVKRGGLNESKGQLNVSASGLARQKPDTDRSNCDQAIILTARNLKLQKQNQALHTIQKQLQHELEQLQQKLLSTQQNKTSAASTTSAAYTHIQNYMKQKQKHLQKKEEKIQRIHKQIIDGLEINFIQQGCNRCCTLVKKIKDSLIKYKVCLEEDIEGYRGIWQEIIGQERLRVGRGCPCVVNI